MLHAYMTLYGICFVATVVIIIALLVLGMEMTEEKNAVRRKRASHMSTAKEWGGYILRAILIAFVVSFAAPLTLIFYIFAIGCAIIASLTEV